MISSNKPILNFGLIGYPLEHSRSPEIHHAALAHLGLRGQYRLYPIIPGDNKALSQLLEKIRKGDIQGLNVTIPHKQNVLPHLDELSDAARAIGAVNTIHYSEGKLIGSNTDAGGFLTDLRNQTKQSASRVLVLGAGGSARAVVYALQQKNWKISIAARRKEQGLQLIKALGNPSIKIDSLPLSAEVIKSIQPALIVNTTPLGMYPKIESSPWPANIEFPKNCFVYDLVYNPASTKLMKQAQQQELRSSNGLGMLVEQAALAFELWSGRSAPRRIMYQSIADPK